MKQTKSIDELTDRELIEKIAIRTKEAADAAKWTKSYIIATSIIALIIFLVSAVLN
jgi:hypothetical protein